eukprot:CAMPEP_0204436320 /NCGR_PEP_ID=MMETSP0470-20130426/75260_1 /ASSEMBLY_ACC=CAM_ASM_000385 /TAXON_ID=2969 /ORGANISM="Oxyrrhis marina" /LENGTH=44 /DNA_ID= /DNA_START= /DNA_END= /DNA_ORIENTATION=
MAAARRSCVAESSQRKAWQELHSRCFGGATAAAGVTSSPSRASR